MTRWSTAKSAAESWFTDMLLWFAGGSIVVVWVVFRSPALDYRLVMAGAVLPAAEALSGHAWFFHTLLAPIVVMCVVMAATHGRRLMRRRWLCLPIGMFIHLLLDGVWTRSHLFWWPAFGFDFATSASLEVSRGIGVDLVLEVLGVVALVWGWKRFGLDDAKRRHKFLSTGQLDRSLVTGPEAGM